MMNKRLLLSSLTGCLAFSALFPCVSRGQEDPVDPPPATDNVEVRKNQQPPAPPALPSPPNREPRQHRQQRGEGRPQHQERMGNRGSDVMQLMQELKKNNPEKYAQLEELRKTDKKRFFEELRKLMPRRQDPTMQKLWENERICRELAEKIKQAKTEEEKAKLTAELKQKLTENFDSMISDTEKRIQNMQTWLEKMKGDKANILEARLQAFLGNKPMPMPPTVNGQPPKDFPPRMGNELPPPPPPSSEEK